MIPLSDLAGQVRAVQRIALATHVEPDPDAIGSLLGLGHALSGLGKDVALLCDDVPPSEVLFLPGVERVAKALPDEFVPQAFIGLDASDAERLGKVSAPLLESSIPVIIIDHHITNLNFGTLNVVDPKSSATAELLLHVLDALGAPITQDIAVCLMTGLVGDTRGFSTDSVTPATLRAAARLVEAGAGVAAIYERIFEVRSFDTLRLWGLALNSAHLEDGVIWTSLSIASRKEHGLIHAGDKGLSNLLLTAEEASISAVLTEQFNGQVVCSFRARPGLDVATVSLALGGGGHPLAAGCTVDGPLDEAVTRVVGLLKQQISQPAPHEE